MRQICVATNGDKHGAAVIWAMEKTAPNAAYKLKTTVINAMQTTGNLFLNRPVAKWRRRCFSAEQLMISFRKLDIECEDLKDIVMSDDYLNQSDDNARTIAVRNLMYLAQDSGDKKVIHSLTEQLKRAETQTERGSLELTILTALCKVNGKQLSLVTTEVLDFLNRHMRYYVEDAPTLAELFACLSQDSRVTDLLITIISDVSMSFGAHGAATTAIQRIVSTNPRGIASLFGSIYKHVMSKSFTGRKSEQILRKIDSCRNYVLQRITPMNENEKNIDDAAFQLVSLCNHIFRRQGTLVFRDLNDRTHLVLA